MNETVIQRSTDSGDGKRIGLYLVFKDGLTVEDSISAIPAKCFPFHLEMPCGQKLDYADQAEVSRDTVPCPCGKPNHWLVVVEQMGSN